MVRLKRLVVPFCNVLLLLFSIVHSEEVEEKGEVEDLSEQGWLLEFVHDKLEMKGIDLWVSEEKPYSNLQCEMSSIEEKDLQEHKDMMSNEIYNIEMKDDIFSIPTESELAEIWSTKRDPRLVRNNINTKQKLIDYIASKINQNIDEFEVVLDNLINGIFSQSNDTQKIPFGSNDPTTRLPISCSNLPVFDKESSTVIQADRENAIFPLNAHDKLELTFKKQKGFMNFIDKKYSCVFVTDVCQGRDADCPIPIDQNHVFIYENFNSEIQNLVRYDQTLKSTIKNIHFTSPVGVTIVNPAQSISNLDYRHYVAGEDSFEKHSRKYQKDMRDFPSYRGALDQESTKGVDIIFMIDISNSMLYDQRHTAIVYAVGDLIRTLNIQDRFSVIGSAYTLSCSDHQNLPGFTGCTEYSDRIWNFDQIPDYSYQYRKQEQIFTPQYNCLKSKLTYANNAIKDKVSFVLNRELLVNDGRSFWNFHGSKSFAAGFDKTGDLLRISEGDDRKKLVIMLTDGEPMNSQDQIKTLSSLNALQKEFNYEITTQIYNVGKQNDFLERIVNQNYDVWTGDNTKQIGNVFQVDTLQSLTSDLKRFYMSSPFAETSSPTKWNWVNPINDKVGIATELNVGPTISVSKAVHDDSDNLIGVLAMDIDTDNLFQPMADMEFGTNRYFIVDSVNHHIISHPHMAEFQHLDPRKTRGFTKNIENQPHLIDNLNFYSYLENSEQLEQLLEDHTANIGSPRNYYCSNSTSNFIVCSYYDDNESSTSQFDAYIPVPLSNSTLPNADSIVLNRALEEKLSTDQKIIEQDFPFWKKDAKKVVEFQESANELLKSTFAGNIATCNSNDRFMYLYNGEQSQSSYYMRPTNNLFENVDGIEGLDSDRLGNLTSFFNSNMESENDYASTGLRGDLADFPVQEVKAMQLLTTLTTHAKAPLLKHQFYTLPLKRQFILPNGIESKLPAIYEEQKYDDITTVDKDEYYFKIHSNEDDNLGTSISMTKKVEVDGKFVGFFRNVWSWIDFHDVLERMIWETREFRCMCPYPPHMRYNETWQMRYFNYKMQNSINSVVECAVKVMNEDGTIIYDEDMHYDYIQSVRMNMNRFAIPINHQLNVIQTYSIYDLVWNSLLHHVIDGENLMMHMDNEIENPPYNGSYIKRTVYGVDEIEDETYVGIPYVFTPNEYLFLTDLLPEYHDKVYPERNYTVYRTDECFDTYHHQILKKYQHTLPDGHTGVVLTKDSAYKDTYKDNPTAESVLARQILWMTTKHCGVLAIEDYKAQWVPGTTETWIDYKEENHFAIGPYLHFKKIPKTNLHMFVLLDESSDLSLNGKASAEKSWIMLMMWYFYYNFDDNCHRSFQQITHVKTMRARSWSYGLPRGRVSSNAVWWDTDYSSRFSSNSNYDACSHIVPTSKHNLTMKACPNNIYRYNFDINKYNRLEEEKTIEQMPAIWENNCEQFNSPSNSKINYLETTTAQYATMLRKLPFIGNKLAEFARLELPITNSFNSNRISPILFKYTIGCIIKIILAIYLYHYIIIKFIWRSVFGQDLKAIFMYIIRRKRQLYLDDNDSDSEDDEIDDGFYESFDLDLYDGGDSEVGLEELFYP